MSPDVTRTASTDGAAIVVDKISKAYRIGQRNARHETLAGAVLAGLRSPLRNFRSLRRLNRFDSDEERDVLWALRDVSFEVARGQVLGIIGRNGAGKSTLLKVLSRITYPTRGRATINGRVASLLEVGTGFHPDLTGRENIFLNGTVMGMTRREVRAKFDSIVDFSGIERFIDTPVKRFSSGMIVRLGFAVAAHLDPEILVIDEVLAVGDAAFQQRCIGKMKDVVSSGRTILFVSHQLAAVQHLCPHSILLNQGRVVAHGPTAQVIETYLSGTFGASEATLDERTDRTGTGRLRFCDLRIHGPADQSNEYLQTGGVAVIALRYRNVDRRPLRHVHVGIGIDTEIGHRVALLSNRDAGKPLLELPAEDGAIHVRIPRLPLLPGRYRLTLFAEIAGEITDWVHDAAEIRVEPGDFYGTGKLPPRTQGDVLLEYDMTADSRPAEPEGIV